MKKGKGGKETSEKESWNWKKLDNIGEYGWKWLTDVFVQHKEFQELKEETEFESSNPFPGNLSQTTIL